jgi:formyl-CoA transferase
VMTMDRLLSDPHLRAREMVVELTHDKIGPIPMPGVAFKLSESPGNVEHLGPALGEHNDEVFGGMLGLSAEEIGRLRAEGVI